MSDIDIAWSKSLFSHASLHVFRTMMVAAAQICQDVAPPNCVVRLWIIIFQSKNHWIKKRYSKLQIFAHKLVLPFTFQVHNSVYQIHCTVYWTANIKSILASKLFQCIISPPNIYMHRQCEVALLIPPNWMLSLQKAFDCRITHCNTVMHQFRMF